MSKYEAGKYNCICDRCGFQFKSSELKKDWQGLMVCAKDYESRHPQDLIKVQAETAFPEWARPEPEDVFLEPVQCTLEGMQAVAGLGIAGCMRTGFVTPI